MYSIGDLTNNFKNIFTTIDSLLKAKQTIIIAIDGNSGSGKSTLADFIQRTYDCNIFHMDDFFLTPKLRTIKRLQEIGGNVDYVRFYNEIILGINTNKDFKFQRYNCQKFKLDEVIHVTPKPLNIVEGCYSMHPTLIDQYDLKIFLHIDRDFQLERILKRNGKSILPMFIHEWIPKENKYFETMDIKNKADLVFNILKKEESRTILNEVIL